MKVVRVDQSQSSFGSKDVKLSNDKLLFDRTIYKHLGSLTENKVLARPESADSEYHRFLLNMNKLHDGLYVPDDIVAMDEYLGSLGITEEYPFPDDRLDTDIWFDVITQDKTRNVVDRASGYNIVDVNTGYNVIHDTSK